MIKLSDVDTVTQFFVYLLLNYKIYNYGERRKSINKRNCKGTWIR